LSVCARERRAETDRQTERETENKRKFFLRGNFSIYAVVHQLHI